MNEVMNICGTNVGIKEYSNQRVVTFADIDRVHQRPDGTAKRNFNKNKNHFIKDVDFYVIGSDEFRTSLDNTLSEHDFMDKTLITETGYLMLVKSFRDDLAWKVQRMLVNVYFKTREEKPKTTLSVEDRFRLAELLNNTPPENRPYIMALFEDVGVKVPQYVEESSFAHECTKEPQPFHATPRGRMEYTKKYADMNGVGDFLKTFNPINRPSAEVYEEYSERCKEQGIEPTSKIMFSKVVNQYLGTAITLMKIKGQVKRVFVEGGS